jgi:hypothetical protein
MVSEPDDLPRLPEDRIEPARSKVSELKPGERVTLSVITNIDVDEEGHVWVDLSSCVLPIPGGPWNEFSSGTNGKGIHPLAG